MKINSLKIKNWCILKDFEIHFDKDLSVLIGENGSGKSSVIEVIALIFGHLYKYYVEEKLNDDFIEGYEINFSSKVKNVDYEVEIQSIAYQSSKEDDGRFKHKLIINKTEYTRKEANNEFSGIGGVKAFLPPSIVLYYAGISSHLESLSHHFDEKYKSKVIKANNTYTITPLNLPDERPFFYCRKQHLSSILLCLTISEKESLNVFSQKIGINPLDIDIIFCIKKPSWAKNADSYSFWGASDGAIKEFLDILSGHSYKSNYQPDSVYFSYTSDLSIKDMLKSFSIEVKELFLFKMLDLLIFNDLLDEITINWKNTDGEVIELERLSEGEKQMILTSGLAALWSVENSLLLFDEPDTFLHPKWQVEFIPILKENLKGNQAIVTTHSPMLISSMKEGDVISMNNGKSVLYVNPTYGKDSNTILSQTMNSLTRAKEVDDKIIEIETLISENKLEHAKVKLSQLIELLEDSSNPTLIRLASIIKRKELIGR